MQAVIIVGNDQAAEQARFELVVGGLGLLQRALRAVQRAGATSVLIVGPQSRTKPVVEHDPTLSIPVTWCEHEGPFADSGAALRAARDAGLLEPTFWLTTADRLVSPPLFPKLPVTTDVLVVEDDVDPVGTFVATPAFTERFAAGEPGDLFGGVRSDDPRHHPGDPKKAVWAVVADASQIPAAMQRLTASLRKPLGREDDGLVAHFINRPISIQISRVLVNTFVTPNQITAVGLAFGLLAAALVASGDWLTMVLAGLSLQTSSLLDGVDGELARMRLTMSHSGEWFDTVCDDVINISFMLGLGIASTTLTGHSIYTTLGIIGATTTAITVGFFYREFIRAGVASHNHFKWGFEKAEKTQKSLLENAFTVFSWIAKRDFYTVLLVTLLVVGLPTMAFVIMFTGSSLISVGYVIQKLVSRAPKGKLAAHDPT